MKVLAPSNDLFSGAFEAMANPTSHMKNHSEAKSDGGTKFDQGKVDLTLVPTVALESEARALMFGEKKYGRYNYTNGFETSRLLAAALRHILAYRDGHDFDSESGLHHLGHARACLAMLLHCEQLGTMRDNRYKGG
jgi:hypothetical protein